MTSRLELYKQILRTYWQRPVVLLLAGLILFSYLYLVFGPTSGDVFQVGPRPKATGRIESVYTGKDHKFQTLSDLLERVHPKEVLSLNLVKLNSNDPLLDLSVFPNLEYLSLSGFDLTEENVNQICQLPRLKALVLLQSPLPAGTLQRFGEKVTQLELLSPALEAHPEEIPKMSKVNLLALHLFNASPDVLERATQIPHLEQLTLISPTNAIATPKKSTPTQTWDQIDLTDAQLEQLRNCPSLKEVYADWFLMKRLRHFTDASLLPVRALPITYSRYKLLAIKTAIFISALLAAILVLQLWAHMILPAAKLLPNFVAPHRHIAVIIFVTGAICVSLGILKYDFGILAALSLFLFFPAVGCLFSLSLFSHPLLRQWLYGLMIPAFFVLLLLFRPLFESTIAGENIWFLQGQMPGLALIIIGIEVFAIAWVLRNLSAITNFVNETSSTMPAFSPWDKERLPQAQWKKPGKLFIWNLDRSLQGLHYSERSTWQMIKLWRRGNAFRPMVMFWIIAIVLFFGLVFQGIAKAVSGEPFIPDLRPLLGGLFASLASAGIALPAIAWFQRRKSLEIESLRPVNRQSLIKQLYLSLAWDHSILMIGFLALFVLLSMNSVLFKTEVICKLLLVSFAAPLWLLGVNTSVLVFKQTWKIVGSILGLNLIASILVLATAALQLIPQSGAEQSPHLLYISTLTAISAACCLNMLMYRAALKREWG